MNMLTKIAPEIATVTESQDLAEMKFEPMCGADEIGLYMDRVRQSHTTFAAAVMLVAMPRETFVAYLRARLEEDQDAAIKLADCLDQHCQDLRAHLRIAEVAHSRYMIAMTEAADLSFAEMFPISPWGAALAKCRALQSAVAASDWGETEETEEAFDKLVSAKTDAEDELIEMDAPDIAALADKLAIIETSYAAGNIGLGVIKTLLSDVRRIAIGDAA